jgi:hypothetical protein
MSGRPVVEPRTGLPGRGVLDDAMDGSRDLVVLLERKR